MLLLDTRDDYYTIQYAVYTRYCYYTLYTVAIHNIDTSHCCCALETPQYRFTLRLGNTAAVSTSSSGAVNSQQAVQSTVSSQQLDSL